MQRLDPPLDQLREYRPALTEPNDFDDFWSQTISESRAAANGVQLDRVDTPLRTVDVFDMRFPGFGGESIAAWLVVPADTNVPLPTVVEYSPYNGGRGLPWQHLGWASSGFAHIVMDVRGQGSGWLAEGATPDPHGSGPSVSGFLTRGIDSPENFVYRRIFTDAVRCIDAARTLDVVDAEAVSLTGLSQGGGTALAAAALSDGLVAVMPDVPFLCNLPNVIGQVESNPYQEVVRYLSVRRNDVERVFHTLSFFDGVFMARRSTAPALFSVGLMDDICPPSSVFAAFNNYGSPAKDIEVYQFNGHEGGGSYQWQRQVRFARANLG